MRVLWSWLNELVELDRSPEEVAELLSTAGLEVDEIENSGPQFSKVVTAKLLDKRQHPNADKLSVCRVTDGQQEYSVVCGATNMEAGDGVALALHKARLPGGRVVKRGKLRGELSDGMLCSEAELEIGDDGDGILILPGDVKTGVPLQQHLGLSDCVIVLDLTPDRADCLGLVGVAREIAALTGCPLKGAAVLPDWGEPVAAGAAAAVAGTAAEQVTVTLEDPQGCPRYTGIVVRGVSIGPSPAWLTSRLQAVGAGVHNNVVDATNYLCRLLGQPFHAFDLRFLRGGQIIVRRAENNEPFMALDGVEHLLCPDDVAICDAEGPVALGGVIGGKGSMVVDDTTDLLLESAYFTPANIRSTSRRLGILTESSDRFARGVDPRNTMAANRMLAELIVELAGGEVVEPQADCNPTPWQPSAVALRPQRVPGLLGLDLSVEKICGLLQRDWMCISNPSDEPLMVEAPPWRIDIEQEVDLVEEVARLWGFDRIPITLPKAERVAVRRSDEIDREVRNTMVELGFSELFLLSFCGREELSSLGYTEEALARTVEIGNPLGADSALLQPSLLPGMLRHAAQAARRTNDLRTFQLRRTFELGKGATGVKETLSLAGLWMGSRRPAAWDREEAEADFFDLKGALEAVLKRFRVGGINFVGDVAASVLLDPAQAARLERGRQPAGVIGRIAPRLLAQLELPPAYVFEIPFGDLVRKRPALRYQAPSEFPSTRRDVAVLVDQSVAATGLLEEVKRAKLADLVHSEIFDVYEGQELPEGKRSIAIRMVFQSATGTLDGVRVDEAFQRVMDRLGALPGVVVRKG